MASETTSRRRALAKAGFAVIPSIGKRPAFDGWQNKHAATLDEIEGWEQEYPQAENTSILTRTTPALDVDIFQRDAAVAVEKLVRQRFGKRGLVLMRIGQPPKRAIPFRSDDVPFAKITVNLIASDGSTGQKIEFLADGQQIVFFGTHPDTRKPYNWHGPEADLLELGEVRRDQLPPITEEEAKALVDDVVQLLIEKFSYKREKTAKNTGDSEIYTEAVGNIIAGTDLHASIRDLGASLIGSGVRPKVAKGLLHAIAESSTAPRDERFKERVEDIDRTVDSAQAKFGEDWPEPKPLPNGLAPVPAFSSDYLPGALAPWVDDISDRLQCPPDYVAVSAVTALGAVIGRRVGIKPQEKTEWIEYANLWSVFIGPPGMLKSPAMQAALAPIHHLEAEAAKEFEVVREAYKANLDAFKVRKQVKTQLEKKALKKDFDRDVDLDPGSEPEEPIEIRFRTNDTTYEAVGELLIGNPTGLLIERDELVSLLRHLDREEQTVARGFYMSGWAGTQPYTFDRIIRGHLHIEAVCLAILGNTQPSRISEYVRRANLDGGGGDGLIQRFGLMVWPDNPPNWENVDEHPDSEARRRAWNVFVRMSELTEKAARKLGAQKGSLDKTPFFRFDEASRREFVDWRSDLERLLRSGEMSPALEGHFAKYRKLVPALALINHLADGGEGTIGLSALRKALAFSKYLESHARRVYGAADMVELAAGEAILGHVRKRELIDGFTARDVHQHGWSNLTERAWVHAGLDLLVDLDYLATNVSQPDQRGGRPKTLYAINPRTF
jgi:hypothetical protein